MDHVIERIRSLCPEDQEEQSRLLNLSLETMDPPYRYLDRPWPKADRREDFMGQADFQSSIVREASRIARLLDDMAEVVEGTAGWVGINPLSEVGFGRLDPMANDIYCGTCGPALYLAAYRHVTSDERFDTRVRPWNP